MESGFSSKVLFVSLVFVMLIGRDAQTQEEAHLGIVFFWEPIVSHGPQSDNLQFLDQALRPNIDPLHPVPQK